MSDAMMSESSTPAAIGDPTLSARIVEVGEGLARPQKELPSRYFYDARGSALFERITDLPEYYPTRCEREILEQRMPAWAQRSCARTVVEPGAGSAAKTRLILDALRDAGTLQSYVPVDVSGDFLAGTARRLRRDYPRLQVEAIVADFTRPFSLPAHLPAPHLVAFLGSTIGNFPPPADVALIRGVAAALQVGDHLLLGTDLRKDVATLEAAYNDAEGVTAEFNRNILSAVNAALGADFDPSAFDHRAFYDGDLHRIEMHLVARSPQSIHIPGLPTTHIAAGESVRTEVSCKYDRASVTALLEDAGLRLVDWATDRRGWFAVSLSTTGASPERPSPERPRQR
ncbi:MAG: L-histidine N(alpha)-methyltransferase [Gemmatimonadaceae bacterium]